ncbi:MAG: TlpA family protein disulfide reductase, partial [Duncaniella sp.]|nr:TlpA family protein disulfide reductase [Duncaniella sp.]
MNLGFVKMTALSLLAGAMAVSCGKTNDGPMLKGHIEGLGEKSEAYLIYSLDGDTQTNVYDKLTLDSLGNFEFNPRLPEGVDFMEVELNIDGVNYGAYVEKGATTDMNVVITDPREYATVTFAGDNADISEAVNVASQAYDFMRYFSMDPSEGKTPEEYSALLDSENARVLSALEGIKDTAKKEYYTKLYGKQYLSQKMSNLSSKLYAEGCTSFKEIVANPDFKALYEQIDINDPMSVKANLTGMWVSINQPYNMDWEKPDVDSMLMNLAFIDENVKEASNRRSAINSAPFMYLEKCKPSKTDAQKYMETYSKVAADYPEIVEKYQKVVDGIIELNEGTPMPYYPVITDTEGNEVNLKDLLGKITYIDIWATWCGPCCREIPYLDEVVKRFKGNDKVQFISISVDDDLDAWKAKLAKDKPEWAQYVITGDEKSKFMSSMGIQGIPRFILLDAQGNFIQNDAVRPSSDNIATVL